MPVRKKSAALAHAEWMHRLKAFAKVRKKMKLYGKPFGKRTAQARMNREGWKIG